MEFETAPDSRSLSVSLIPNAKLEFCLLCENALGNITALYGHQPNDGSFAWSTNGSFTWPNNGSLTWQDISYNLYTSSPNTTFRPPFTSGVAKINIPVFSNSSSTPTVRYSNSSNLTLCIGGNDSIPTSGNCSIPFNSIIAGELALQTVFLDSKMGVWSTPWYQNGSFRSGKLCRKALQLEYRLISISISQLAFRRALIG